MVALSVLALALSAAGLAAAQSFAITDPSKDVWWGELSPFSPRDRSD